MQRWTTTGTGYEARSVPSAASTNTVHRLDLRWGRLSFAQLRDEEFLAKQLRRIEITQGARRVGRPTASEAATLAPDRTIRQRLQAAQTKAARGASEDEDIDAKDDTLVESTTKESHTQEKNERELTNALCVLGNLQQTELAAVMVTKLKEALQRVCTFPNPVYQLIALRRQLMKSMHEAVAAQHRQRKAADQLNLSIVNSLENSLADGAQVQPADPAGLLSGSTTFKPKEKVTREAVMGIQVLVGLLGDLHDPAVATMTQRREFLEDLLPLLCSMGFLSLAPKRGLNASGLASSRVLGPSPDIVEFTEKIQRFLLDMCPPSTGISSPSPKLAAISSGSNELDVVDRTNAMNGLIHLAAATGSVKDFLVVLRVLLGASDYAPDSMAKEVRNSLSSRSLLTSSVPSLTPVRTEELLPSPIHPGRNDDEMVQVKLKAKEAGAVRLDLSLSTREGEDSAVQDVFKRKVVPKGLKTITANAIAGATTVNLAMPNSSSPSHRLLYSSPGNNVVNKHGAKTELDDVILMGNDSLSLDMSRMMETLARDTSTMSTRSETPIVTARCPKFKALNIQSVLVELDRAKPSAPMRVSRGKPTPAGGDTNTFARDEEEGDREVWSCGQNSYGELGHGDTASRKSFERIESLQHKEIVQIGAGNEHTIALTGDGKVLTCGYNDNGQCGQGGTARVSHLSEIPKLGETAISQVHAYNGCEHTILVTMDGRAATCGYNYRGQLGHGNTASESVPKIVRSLENRIVRLVSCSYYHTVMACEEDGGDQQFLYTFGRNDYGQLGHNDSIDRKVPQRVEALNDQHAVSVACGQYHTIVVTATGKAFAFGKNDYGQLGMDSMENQLVPVQVRAGLEKQECLEIRCGYYHSIVLCSGAHLFGFGRNDYGQLGLARPNSSSTTNLQLQQQRFSYARLIEELEGKDIVRFACGCYHTVAVSDNGVMYVFGRNNHGQLGTGDTNERVYPFPIDDFVGKRVALVAAGFYHTVVLTGGKDEKKHDQDAIGNDKGEACSSSVPNGITHTTVLSTSVVQELLNSSKRPELETSGLISNDEADTGTEVPAIDPTDDDFRDEDSRLGRNSSFKATSKVPTDSADPLFVVMVILAQLDRLCQPFIPKPGIYPSLQHPTMATIDALTASSTSSSANSFDASSAFEGSFEPFGIHNCSSTFDTLAILLKHLSTKKLEATSPITACLAPQLGISTVTPRRATQSSPTGHLQIYVLLACIRILQANISQFLRSGMAKAVILHLTEATTGSAETKPWEKELDRTRVSVLQVREVLLALVDIKHRRNVCYVLDNAPNEGENATRIADVATATLMQGFELFFPCQCLQRQFCMHTLHEFSSNERTEHACGVLCRRDQWMIDSLPKSKALMLEPLLRRMTEDTLVIRFLPSLPSNQRHETESGRVSLVTEVYQLLLNRIAADFSRRLGDVVAVRTSSDDHSQQEATLRAFFNTLGGLQKHLSSWAASVHEWTVKDDAESLQPGVEIGARVASVIDRVFRVDEHDLEQVPAPWRCFMEFSLAVLGQCCEVLGQFFSMEPLPSPSHGYNHRVELGAGLQDNSLQAKMLEAVENSIVGQVLPLLVVSLFEFSNNSLFAAVLLPSLKTLLRLLDGLNQRDSAVENAEKAFVENVASSLNPRPPQKDTTGSFRRKSGSNLLLLGSAREDDGKITARKGPATSDAMALPWRYRLEKELAVLAAEMAVTLVIGDPYFTYDAIKRTKISDRWLSSPLFRGGLNSRNVTQSIKHVSTARSKHARVVQHTPFPAVVALNAQPFSLILPPLNENRDTIQLWGVPTEANYAEMFCPDSVRRFLVLLQNGSDSETQKELCDATAKLCCWVRDNYAKKDPSYRMLIRQSQLSVNLKTSMNPVERRIHENDTQIEVAFFAALLHHNMLGSQAYHFALGIRQSSVEARSPPPRSLITLWQCVAQLRRRVAAKKTEIKNTPQSDVESPRENTFDRILALQQSIIDRCQLLLLIDIHEEQEHVNLQLDAGYIAPYDPAFLVSASSVFNFSASSTKRHLRASYTDEKVPFLAAFPSSKWRKVRMIVHSIIRWKFVAAVFRSSRQERVSQEVLAYVTSDEAVSSTTAIKTLLVDPCRRVSCSVRGLEILWELLTFTSLDSIKADIAHQIAQVFVFQSPAHSILAGSHNVGYFYSSLQNEAFSEFVGQLTEMMTDKAALLMESSETETSSSFWIVIVLLSVWGIHFNVEQFEFVSDIGILGVIQEMMQGLFSKRSGDGSTDASPSIPSVDSIVGKNGQPTAAYFTTQKQLARLEDTLWVLFRYICVHFGVQNVRDEAAIGGLTQRNIYVPTFPVLSNVAELLYNEAVTISTRFLPLVDGDGVKSVESAAAVPVTVRRSFEVITLSQRFSGQSRGVTCSYDDMISPSGSETVIPMSPLIKPNEFSVTTWLYINNSLTPRPQTRDDKLFELPVGLQDRQLVFLRGASREISLYLVLVPESVDNWQLEVGILMDLNREAGDGECAIKGRMWERVVSKQVITGGKWFHVAVVLEATKLRLYLNGILDCQRSLATQSIPIWAAGNVDLPLHFGRFPKNSAVYSAIGFLSRSLGIMTGVAPSDNALELQKREFKSFDGWLSHFRFHNRSLSPIHVRIVFDEKKSAPPTGLPPDSTNDQYKIVELHALLVLLSSSSEGLVHFTSQFSKWMRLVWGTFVGTGSTTVQQSALRVLRALLPLQCPLEASNVLVRDGPVQAETLGFYKLEDVCVQQMVRMIGFCLNKCQQTNTSGDNGDMAVVPWTLMPACGIHANQFSPDVRSCVDQETDLPHNIEVRYQSFKRQSLMIANELSQLLQYLFRCSNEAWRQSIISVASSITQNFASSREKENVDQLDPRGVQFGKQILHFSTIKSVESMGLFYFLGGGVEFLRPGVTVEMNGSRECAQVLSLEYRTSSTPSQNPPETPSDTKPPQIVNDTLAYVCIDSNSNSLEIAGPSSGMTLEQHKELTWCEEVFGWKGERPSFSKVNVDELNPAESTNPNWKGGTYPSVVYDMASQRCNHQLFGVLVEKAAEVIPVVYNIEATGQQHKNLMTGGSDNVVGCMLLKILAQLAGITAGVDELLAKPALIGIIAELAISEDGNLKHATLYQVEKRVSALRREVYTALVELGEEEVSELETLFNSSEKLDSSAFKSENVPLLNGEGPEFDTSRATGRRSLTQTPTEAMPSIDVGDDAVPSNENWDPAQGDDQEPRTPIQDDDDDDDDDEGDDEDDDDEEGSLEDVDNDEEDEDEADDEESRAEFVEELMLMGFPEEWCVLALKQTENDIVAASAWIVDNLEYLSKLQSTLDKERDKGRDSPRFDEEEDDVVSPNDSSAQPPSLNSSNSWAQSVAWQATDEDVTKSDSPVKSRSTGCEGDSFAAPPLTDKEMGRKLFGEMYFPFEDGGFLSNTKTRFMRSWRAEAMEMKMETAPPAPQPIGTTPDASRSAFEGDFQTEINQLNLRGLIEELRRFENSLSILYARQCMITLLHQTTSKTDSSQGLTISYAQWFKLLKLVLLRGDQFTILSSSNVANANTMQLQEFSVDEVFSKALRCFVDRDASAVTTSAFEFCLKELETAAYNKIYEAVLWTQRDLQRPDKAVVEEPGIETVVWLLDTLLVESTSSSISLSVDFAKTVLRRLRCCLGTTNLPLKFVVLRIISRVLVSMRIRHQNVMNEAQLVVGEFLTAAIMRHNRELVQGRLLFSQYLQGYIELLHVLQSQNGFSDPDVTRHLAGASISQEFSGGGGGLSQSLRSPMPFTEDSSLHFDRKRSRSSLLAFAEDGLSVSYSGNEVWKAACAGIGFSTGVHSWMVRIEKSSSPYLFVGVATRQANLDSFLGADDQSWGFIGDKALYYQRNRIRAYGENFTEGDCIGLRLDCEKGELSFSKNGVDLGVAFDNIVGEVCPAVAFYSRHQKLSFVKDSCVSSDLAETPTSPTGEDGTGSVEDCLITCEIMDNWVSSKPVRSEMAAAASKMTTEWLAGSKKFVTTRSGKSLRVDVTREACTKLGFYSDDRVRTPRGNGVVVGVAAGRIWVEVDNEPGTWFFHPSKLRVLPGANSTMMNTLPNTPVDSSSNRDAVSNKTPVDNELTKAPSPSFTLSLEELIEYGEHSLWSMPVDRELLNVINDFCEVSRTSPWNLTPSQLLTLINDKTGVLELTPVASVLAMPREKLEKLVVARFALLRFYNMYVSRALPFFDLTWLYFLPDSNSLPCRLISQCRGSLFVCVKNALWTSLMERTANSPKRSDDEYDYPEDLPQLQVNRLKAAAAKCHEGTISSLFLSLFGQAFEELHFLPLKTLRMVYSHPMDDGQLRSFKVKFEGEGVDDYGGPYREFFSQFFAELQMLYAPEGENNANKTSDSSTNGGPSSTSFKLDPGVSVSACVLPFLVPSPNWRNGVGANREKFVLNGALINYSGQGRVSFVPGESAEEKRQLYCEMFYFLGQMIGICLRTRVCVRLDLAMTVWKQLVAEGNSSPENALETLKEIDFVAYSLWKTLKCMLDELKRLPDATATAKRGELEEQLVAMDLVFTTVLSDGQTVELCEDGSNTAVTLSNLEKYLDAMLRARVQETQEVMNIVKQGLHSIMPVSALALLTWTELEKRMCGVAEVDVKLLQANTEYDEDLSPNDEFIQRFWRVLESLEPEDKRAFLRFVWARSRLPLGSAQFHQKFKIQALASSGSGDGNNSSGGSTANSGGWMDSQMPKSHTCFFALQLPRYSSDEICRERLLYAVRNCVEMDGDFRLADTEMTGWTGISPTDQLRI